MDGIALCLDDNLLLFLDSLVNIQIVGLNHITKTQWNKHGDGMGQMTPYL